MSPMKTVVVKVGGSLLSLRDLPQRMQELRNSIESEKVLFIAGGGPAADVIRSWDATHGLAPEVSHHLAIETLGLTAQLLVNLLPGANLTAELPETGSVLDCAVLDCAVLDVPVILARLHGRGETPLPAGWDVTSDSIAAWIAIHWPAEELILAKSTEYTRVSVSGKVAAETSPHDFVDPWLRNLAPALPVVSWCNLRNSPAERCVLDVQ